jgi:uncharacterized membrane protein (DUF485 family)
MSSNTLVDKAEAMDVFIHRIAVIMLVMSFNFALTASQYFVSDLTADVMDKVQSVAVLIAVAWMLPSLWRLKMSRANDSLMSDSYIGSVFKKEAVKAFSLTYLFLVVAEIAARAEWFSVPTTFYISFALAFTTAVFGVSFFVFNRSDDHLC